MWLRRCYIVLLTYLITLTSCEQFRFDPNIHYTDATHPSIVLQLIEDNKHLFSINGIFDAILKILDDVKDAFENPATTQDVYRCAFALSKYLGSLKNASMWALKMVDSTSKIQSGLLNGHFVNLGHYDECVRINAPLDHNYTMYGQHCLVDLQISLPPNVTLEIDGVKQPISLLLGSNTLTLTMGQCFPSDCPAYLIEHLYNTVLFPINFFINGTGYQVVTSVDAKDCHLYSRPNYTVAEWLVMMVIVMILFLGAVCTVADLVCLQELVKTTPAHPGIQMVLAFSVTRNFNKLTSTESSPETMSVLNGLKVISIMWVVMGHRYRYLIAMPLSNLTDIADQLKDWTKMFIFSAPLSVDTFFMISGMLNMYVFCSIRAKKPRYTPVELLMYYLHRYIRLTPAYAMMVALTATWIYRLGDGPMWDRIMGPATEECKVGWWQNIIYLNNYLDPENYCLMQSWYLAADMQMFWLSPLLLYPLWKWPQFGYVEVVILAAGSVASPFLISYFEGIKTPIPMSTDKAEQLKIMDLMYLPTHTKITGYIVGILTGYLLYGFRKQKIKFRMNKIVSALLWIAAATCMLYAMFGSFHIIQLNSPYSRAESAFYIGFYKLFWTAGLMWIIIACTMGYGGPVNTFLSAKIFGPLGRLTYCIYLTHVAIILYDISSRRMTTYYTDYGQVQAFFGDMFFVIICATILSVLLESPLITIEKIIFGRREPPKRSQPHVQPETESGSIQVAAQNSSS
ncbi:nose resistant to fluoxetine protein 6-like isoform X2 [Rhodnius prolixus]|uniref:nose resistant to fluoxetine protein 6-like isoform X2 n=1 Tax=Rhodnius prolixus TaxID=13249 RepID=UPI003D18BD21